MDLKTQIIILREHSAYLTQLSTEISSLLTTAEHSLAEPQSATHTDIPGAEQIADVLKVFSKEADVFCGRIKSFLETYQPTNGTQRTDEPA